MQDSSNSNLALVTGAGGFIGSHLVEYLVSQGVNVRAFVHYNSRGNWGWLEQSPAKEKIQVVLGDLRDFDSVNAAMKGVSSVFHLGALIGIPYSYVSPLAYVKTNVEGTYNVLEAARHSGVRRVLNVSTSEVYGTARYTPIDENHPLQPQSPYSATKISAENIALSYYNSFGLPVVVVRPFNTFGPRQSARAVIPTIISQALSGADTLTLGSTKPVRDFTYVHDTVTGLFKISQTDLFVGKTVNIGTSRSISIADLITSVGKILGKELKANQEAQRVRPEKSEVMELLSNNSYLLKNTDWKPQFTLEQGLEKTIDWVRSNMGEFKPKVYSV